MLGIFSKADALVSPTCSMGFAEQWQLATRSIRTQGTHSLESRFNELQAKLSATPQIEYVAVLNDDQASASMLVTFDPKNGKLTLQRVGSFQEASEKSLQLRALPPSSGPRSL